MHWTFQQLKKRRHESLKEVYEKKDENLTVCLCVSEHILVRSGRLQYPSPPQHHFLHQTGQVLPKDGHRGCLWGVSPKAWHYLKRRFFHIFFLKSFLTTTILFSAYRSFSWTFLATFPSSAHRTLGSLPSDVGSPLTLLIILEHLTSF